MKRFAALILAAFLALFPLTALAEAEVFEDDSAVYTMHDPDGNVIMRHGGRIYVGDEYISADNMLYRVIAVDDTEYTAISELVGVEPFDEEEAQAAFSVLSETSESGDAQEAGGDTKDKKKLVCMYSTHSDESYVKGDGTESKMEDAGIYDVGNELKKNLEEQGIEVVYSKETHHPHDAGAYRRSRRTAEELLKQQPAALIDLHRDGIPDPEEYAQTIEGEDVTKIRLLIGRSNPNASSNRSFAKQIKRTADEKYPGLIRDIYIGKGNYNQELYPQAILLEFGTHTSEKDEVINSTKYMAEVLDDVLFGGSAKAAAEDDTENNKSGATGIAWLIGLAVLGAILYALVATGSFKGMAAKLGRGASEITGGIVGKKPDDEEDP